MGFRHLATLVERYGRAEGARRYNGTGAAAEAYSRDLLASAQESANVAAERYRAGVGNIIDLLTAEAALEVARAQEVQARADWFVAVAQLAHDTGTLTR